MRSHIFDTISFDNLFTDFFSARESNPRDLVVELDDSFEISLELPGVSKSDIDIQVDAGYLNIKAIKKQSDIKGKVIFSSGLSNGFNKSYKLGTCVDSDSIKAEYRDGMLLVKVGKKETSKSRKIEIG